MGGDGAGFQAAETELNVSHFRAHHATKSSVQPELGESREVGKMSHGITNDDRERIQAALAAGDKIDAIKMYRLATGAGLAEAKQAVEAIEAGQSLEPGPLDVARNEDVDAIQTALFAGKKIQAIKLYRESTGKGLKESKNFIEALEVELRRIDPTRFTTPAAKGCGTAAIVLFVLFGCVVGAVAMHS